jgi:hypothetical protein
MNLNVYAQADNDHERCDVGQVECTDQSAVTSDPLLPVHMDVPSDICLQYALQPDRHACIQRLFQTVWEGILRLQSVSSLNLI